MKSPLVIDEKEFEVNKEISEQVEQEVKENIPSGYISIKLPSNGRIENIPKVLHFRDYSASEALDINTPNDEDRPKVIAKVLTQMCYERDINIADLPVPDVLYILYVLQGTFISSTITKKIILDESSDSEDDSNTEEVDIPISSLHMTYLGCDKDDNELPKKIKIPFKVTDSKTKDVVEFKFTSLNDNIKAQNYCKKFYADEFTKFSSIRKVISDIQQIHDGKKKDQMIDEYMNKHYDECKQYFEFNQTYMLMVAKIVQALQIVSYNGKKCETLEDCWDVYENKLSSTIWNTYNKITEDYPFGLNEEVEVYSSKLSKKLTRNIQFQLSDFISINDTEDNERYFVSFD